jgi:hypothetical protein
METPNVPTPAPAPKLAAAVDTTTLDTGASPSAGGAPTAPAKSGGTMTTVLLVSAGALAVIGLAVWWSKRHKKGAA